MYDKLFQQRRFLSRWRYGAVPKIDQTNTLAIGLKGCWLPGLNLANLVDGSQLTWVDTTNTGVRAEPYGVGAFGNGANLSNGMKSLGPVYLTTATDWSIFGLMRVNTANGSGSVFGPCIYGERATSGNDAIKFCYFQTPHLVQIFIRNDAGTSVSVLGDVMPGSLTVNDGKYHVWVATKKGTSGTNLNIYCDGFFSNSGSWGGPDTYTNAGLAGNILGDIADTSGNLPGTLVISACWTRVINAAEISMLAQNPFCFIQPAEEYYEVLQAQAAPAVTAVFRKTASMVGTRTGTRQTWAV